MFVVLCFIFFFFKQKTAYEMRISDWSSDVVLFRSPILGQTGKSEVDRAVTVRVVFTHDVADDAAALAIGPARDIAGLLTGIENATMYRLQTVSYVRQGAADDDRHGVVEKIGRASCRESVCQ